MRSHRVVTTTQRPPGAPPADASPGVTARTAQRAARLTDRARRRAVAIAGFVVVILLFLATLAFGSVTLPLADVVTVLLGGTSTSNTGATIVVELRLPRAIIAALAGAALGVGGLLMQTLFRNPLASPGTLGITSGASLGVAAVVLISGGTGGGLLTGLGLLSRAGLAVAAVTGAMAVMLVLLLIARRVTSGLTLILLGLMIGYTVSAVVSVLIFLSDAERIQDYIIWTLGSFARAPLDDLLIITPIVVAGLTLAWLLRDELNTLLLGDRYAETMGVSVRRVRALAILSASMLAGIVTAFCGPVIFIGVAVPHLARGLFGTADHRVLVPGVMLVGAAVALLAGFVAHLPGSQYILPLNAVTALIGAPVVIGVLRSRKLTSGMAG